MTMASVVASVIDAFGCKSIAAEERRTKNAQVSYFQRHPEIPFVNPAKIGPLLSVGYTLSVAMYEHSCR
jgi:hypothetical protein